MDNTKGKYEQLKVSSLTKDQKRAAEELNEGDVIFFYKDATSLRIETEDGEDPYVWRNGNWVKMKGE